MCVPDGHERLPEGFGFRLREVDDNVAEQRHNLSRVSCGVRAVGGVGRGQPRPDGSFCAAEEKLSFSGVLPLRLGECPNELMSKGGNLRL